MDMRQFIESFQVLNVDKNESTVSVDQFIFAEEIKSGSYIVSDADEELLILFKFKKNVNLNSMKVYSLPKDDEDGNDTCASPPKSIHIYKINDLNIDFDDAQSLQSDMSITCKSKKLQKGQKINFKKYPKIAIKFNSIKYLGIYINSNQNDTEQTYLNAITLKGSVEDSHQDHNVPINSGDYQLQFNTSDQRNMVMLKEIQSEISTNDTTATPIDSGYLCTGYNPYRRWGDEIKQCVLDDCQCFKRICNVLQMYRLYIDSTSKTQTDHCVNDDQKHSIDDIIQDNDDSTELLNDFNHLLTTHCSQFEDIYNKLVENANDGKTCVLGQCLLYTRNRRDRSVITPDTLYFNDDAMKQELVDRIHCYYFHSFDTGYRLTDKEKKCIMDEQDVKQDPNESNDDDKRYDANASRIHKIVKTKRHKNDNISGLTKDVPYNKFMLDKIDLETKSDDFSYGYRYFYWPYYKNNPDIYDDAHQMTKRSGHVRPEANDGYSVGDWFILNKYKNLKAELLMNRVCSIDAKLLLRITRKAACHWKTKRSRAIKCSREDLFAKCYELKWQQPIQIHHILAMMIYCNFDELQRKFTETFRRKNKDESDDHMKERHRNFCFLGRYLREMAECFGMESPAIDPKSVTLTESPIRIYHGISKQCMFPSLNACIKGPFSTTRDYNVALNFGENGMILELAMYPKEWRFSESASNTIFIDAMRFLNCVDCAWLSDFPGESEIFCIGGLAKFHFNTIIEAIGNNYFPFIDAMRRATYFMTYGGPDIDLEHCGYRGDQKQMVFRLLSHELWTHEPNHEHAHEWKQCPVYIKQLLHAHCQSIKRIHFPPAELILPVRQGGICRGTQAHFDFVKESSVHHALLKYDNGWIKLDLVMKMFPNTEYIVFDGPQDQIQFYQQPAIYLSVLQFLKFNQQTNLQKISLEFPVAFENQMKQYIAKYQKLFEKQSWFIFVHRIENHLNRTLMNPASDFYSQMDWSGIGVSNFVQSVHIMVISKKQYDKE
eukprot:1006550_1